MPVRGEKGQTLVEFALVLPILLLLIIGMLEFGRVLNAWLIVSNGAREGARYATVRASEAEVVAKVKEACPTLDSDSLMVEVTDEDTQMRRSEGIIALQLHAGPPMKVEFRNIRIKELK